MKQYILHNHIHVDMYVQHARIRKYWRHVTPVAQDLPNETRGRNLNGNKSEPLKSGEVRFRRIRLMYAIQLN